MKSKLARAGAVMAAQTLLIAAIHMAGCGLADYAKAEEPKPSYSDARTDRPETVDLSEKQAESVKVEPAGERLFAIEKGAVGSIDFNEDMSVQVYTPYQGKIIAAYGKIGDEVKKGQTLFSIDSPDLLNARVNSYCGGRRS